jgi:hypothetical protein
MNPAAADTAFAAALCTLGLLAADILWHHLRKVDRQRRPDADEHDRHQAYMQEVRKYSDEEPRYRR